MAPAESLAEASPPPREPEWKPKEPGEALAWPELELAETASELGLGQEPALAPVLELESE